MKRQTQRIREKLWLTKSRRGAIAVMAAAFIVVVFAFLAFSVDLGYIARTKAQLQNATDAAVLAGAMELDPNADQAVINNTVRDAVVAVAAANEAGDADSVFINRNFDIKLGRRTFNPNTYTYSYEWGATPYNIVEVRARRTRNRGRAKKLPLLFGPVIGHDSAKLKTVARATFQPRDMLLVLDYSGSMNFDGQYRSVNNLGQQTVEDMIERMWDDLGNPTYGNMTNFDPAYLTAPGIPADPANNIPHIDVTWKGKEVFINSTMNLSRVKLRFTNGRTKTFSSPSGSSGTFKGSGRTSGKIIEDVWVRSGDNDDLFGSNGEQFEFDDNSVIAWLGLNSVTYPGESGTWRNFVDYVVNSSSSQPYYSYDVYKAGFRRKFGVMSLINFWNQKKKTPSQTSFLWQVHQQPLGAVKDACDILIDFLEFVEAEDQLGLAIYTHPNSNGAILENALSHDYDSVRPNYRQRQAAHYQGNTNIGAGMRVARWEIEANARPKAFRQMVLLTDGLANASSTSSSPTQFCIDEAYAAKASKIRIMTVSVGDGADTSLMQQIADITDGVHFNVPGGQGPDDYEQQLKDVFAEIAADRPLKLIDKY